MELLVLMNFKAGRGYAYNTTLEYYLHCLKRTRKVIGPLYPPVQRSFFIPNRDVPKLVIKGSTVHTLVLDLVSKVFTSGHMSLIHNLVC